MSELTSMQSAFAARLYHLSIVSGMDQGGCDTDEQTQVVGIAMKKASLAIKRLGYSTSDLGTLQACIDVAKRDVRQQPESRVVPKFITTDSAITADLRKRGYLVAGTLDEQVPVHEFYIFYSDRQQRRVRQYVERVWKWNVRSHNDTDVTSFGWYSTPELAIKGVERMKVLVQQYLAEKQEQRCPRNL